MIRGAVSLALLVGLLAHARAAEAACASRPTDPGGYEGYAYAPAEARSHATPRVRVHWAVSGPHAPAPASARPDGVPDSVAYAADVAEGAPSTGYYLLEIRKL